MIHHVHNTLLSETSNPVIGQNNNAPVDRASLENFRGALSAAREAIGGGSTNRGSIEPEDSNPLSIATYTQPSTSLPIPPTSTTSPANTAAPATSNTTSNATSNTTGLDAQQAFDNAYWAAQPAAVQALRTMQDPSERATAAEQLASEGYSIDMPIMVWGWDPSIVMSMRQAEGYTWVPSALQNPVEMLPGLSTMGGLAAYNPKDPPAGSITVS